MQKTAFILGFIYRTVGNFLAGRYDVIHISVKCGWIVDLNSTVRPNIISAEYSAEISADYSVRSRQLQIAETKRFSFRQIVTFSALTASFGRIFGQISAESAFFGRKFSVSAKITEYSVSAEFRFQFGFCQIFEAVFLFLHKLRNLFRSYAA